ncbi:MAG TPA: DUF934 domain-containing protein [Myxococcota bacterium]|nr:DUF934 domain-containing protein [Myxococcota bacterium]
MRAEPMDELREPSGSGHHTSQTTSERTQKTTMMILDCRLVPRRFPLTDTPDPGAVVPFATWLASKARGEDLSDVGVLFPNDKDVAELAPHLAELPVVALHFPRFQDGRAYTQARKLTHLLGYRGVVLATGDVLRDQVLYMSRVGFNAFHLREDQDAAATLNAFRLYSAFYQYAT